jgi:hypothetical protein
MLNANLIGSRTEKSMSLSLPPEHQHLLLTSGISSCPVGHLWDMFPHEMERSTQHDIIFDRGSCQIDDGIVNDS